MNTVVLSQLYSSILTCRTKANPRTECRFQTEVPNVVHMTVKPQEVVDEEDAKTGKGGGRRDGEEEAHAGCRCVIL